MCAGLRVPEDVQGRPIKVFHHDTVCWARSFVDRFERLLERLHEQDRDLTVSAHPCIYPEPPCSVLFALIWHTLAVTHTYYQFHTRVQSLPSPRETGRGQGLRAARLIL